MIITEAVEQLECKYITFVDADDWVDSDAYMKMKQYMEEEVDVISFRIVRYYDETKHSITDNICPPGKYDEHKIRDSIFFKQSIVKSKKFKD